MNFCYLREFNLGILNFLFIAKNYKIERLVLFSLNCQTGSCCVVHCPGIVPTFNSGVEWPPAVPGLPLPAWNCSWVQRYLKYVISEGSRLSQFTNHFTWREFLGIFTKGFFAIMLASLSHSSGHLSGWDFCCLIFVPVASQRRLWMPLLTLVLLFFLILQPLGVWMYMLMTKGYFVNTVIFGGFRMPDS